MSFARRIGVLFAGFLLLGHAGAEVAPSVEEITEDGFTYRQLTFTTEKTKVTFSPPPGWTFRGNKSRLQLVPPAKPFAEGSLESVSLPQPEPFDEQVIAAFKEQVLASVPAGSQAVTIEFEAENTTMLEGNPSYEIMLTYQSLGRPFKRSVVLVNGPKERLLIRFTALKDDFNALITPFRRAIMSWRTTELKPPGNHPAPAAAVEP